MKFNLFSDRTFYKSMIKLAVPIALQNLLVSSFTLVDTIMVGQLGDAELAAVGMAGQYSWLLTMVLFGVVSAMSMFVSQYWGDKNIDGIHRVYGIALASGTVLSLVFLCAAFFVPEMIMYIFNKDPEVIKVGASYLKIAAFSYPAVMLGNVMFALLRSTECVKVPMVISLIATLANAFFNYGLIFGKFGLPEMGIQGAALATVISSWLNPICALVIAKIQKLLIAAPISSLFAFTRKMVSEFYKKAFPVILNESLWGAGSFVITLLLSNLGKEEYAAVTILKTFENIAFVFFVGICNASCVLIGKAVGSGHIDNAVRYSKKMAVIVPLCALPIGGLIILFREKLVYLFNMGGNLTETTLNTALAIITVYACEIAIRNIPYIQIVGIFRPGGETVKGLFYDLLCLWGFSIPATAIAAYVLKLDFVFVYMMVYLCEDIPKSILCIKYFLTEKWIKPVTETGIQALNEYRARKQNAE